MSLSIIWQNLFFLGSMLIFSLRYPRNKFQITFLSALVCPDTRLQPPTPQPPNQQSTRNHYCTMWLDGVKVQDLTNQPQKLYRQRVTKWSFPKKSLHKGGQVPLQKMLESYKNEGISPFHQSNELSKNTGILTNLGFFWQSWSRTIPSHFGHLYGCLMIWPPSLHHVAWPHFTH